MVCVHIHQRTILARWRGKRGRRGKIFDDEGLFEREAWELWYAVEAREGPNEGQERHSLF
jgi:hypothetical protein